MQFIENGPDIPERLLEAHEEGNVVFFCGAGISYPAGLPGFKSLVDKLYDQVGHIQNPVQQSAIKANQYDTAIALLESEIIDGREKVRNALASILTPNYTSVNSKLTHQALLTLSKSRNGNHHLVTTNFDRIFEDVKIDDSLDIPIYKAPLLPVPKNRLNGLVYLHGLIPETPTNNELDHLVISSGDFGLAYLNERWAARFVSELFRNYTVCFIGYSLEDPVLRYMMDALAADKLLGESPPEMFAFGSFSKGQREKNENEWKAKNVTPILYAMKSNHYNLHHTLREWANTYRDGVNGKEKIIIKHALSMPVTSTKEDDFVGRVLWSLSDKYGLSAKRFADLNPSPPIEWLEAFTNNVFMSNDLTRFGVTPDKFHNDNFKFSLLNRPTPYKKSKYMSLAGHNFHDNDLDEVMLQLARWLLKHINDPKLILWIATNGGILHSRFSALIEEELIGEGVTSSLMQTLWEIVLNDSLKTNIPHYGFYQWTKQLKAHGLSYPLRMQLRNLLSPKLKISESFMSTYRDRDTYTPETERENVKKFLDWDIQLESDHLISHIRGIQDNEYWINALPELLADFSSLLHDTFELMYQLGDIDEKNDFSYLHQASIIPHPQNNHFKSWTVLIELTRDSWIQMINHNIKTAQMFAESWISTPYPLFKRLAFFAATYEHVIDATKAVDWLLSDDVYWLWSGATKHEVMQLLISLATRLGNADLIRIEQAILNGPPEEMIRTDLEEPRLQKLHEYSKWLRLSKLRNAGAILSQGSNEILDIISQENTTWSFSDNGEEEFSVFTNSGERFSKVNNAPHDLQELVIWLKENPSIDTWEDDDWQDLCINNFRLTLESLCTLSQEEVWPIDRWSDAIYAWSTSNKLLKKSWLFASGLFDILPDNVINDLSYSLGSWLKAEAKVCNGNEDTFFSLITKILKVPYEINGEIENDIITDALNHPIGYVTQALISHLFRGELKDNQSILFPYRQILTTLCNTEFTTYQYGRTLISSHLITFFRIDNEWTIEYLLPLFDWDISVNNAKSVWCGFLWSPRLYAPLLKHMKKSFLSTAEHYGSLGSSGNQYAALLTFAGLEYNDVFSKEELALTTSKLPEDGLNEVLRTLISAIKSDTPAQTQEYLSNRVLPYLQKIWPKSHTHRTKEISESMADLIVASGDSFSNVFRQMKGWLLPIEYPYHVLANIIEANIAPNFPEDVLEFLSMIIGDTIGNDADKLQLILNELESHVSTDPKYIQLSEKLRL